MVLMQGDRGDVFQRLHAEHAALTERKAVIRSRIEDEELASMSAAPAVLSQVRKTPSVTAIFS